jgi:amino-acid N-acetyltransferase
MILSTIIKGHEELSQLLDLLETSKLPFRDIRLEGNLFKIYRDATGKLLGTGGLEFYDHSALIRSVAVVESERGKSTGKQIVQDLLEQAKVRSIKSVYLLTETAPGFFEKLGFRNVSRESVPDAVKASSEFSSVCPTSAACMEFSL